MTSNQLGPYYPSMFASTSRTPTPRTFRCSTSDHTLIVIHPQVPLILGGTFQIQCLYGSVELNGYVLRSAPYNENRFLHVCLPIITHIPISIRAHYFTEQLKADRLKWRIKEVSIHSEEAYQAFDAEEYGAVVLISTKLTDVDRFFFSIKNEAFFCPRPLYKCEKLRNQCYTVQNEKVELFQPLFEDAYNRVCYRIEEYVKNLPKSIVMLVGNKGVGKSTLIRNLINRIFSIDTTPAVYLLDLDVGQSEKNPPGLLSLLQIHSDRPLLGSPISHQESTFPCSYFFGSNSPEINVPLYIDLAKHLTDEFHKNSNARSIMVVNSVGWIKDKGYEVMLSAIANIDPNLIINLKSHNEKHDVFEIPMGLEDKVVELTTTFRLNHYITAQNKAADLRDNLFGGYFSNCLSNGRLYREHLSDVKPLSVPFSKIAVYTHYELPEISDDQILCALNVAVVAFCSIDPVGEEAFEVKNILDDDSGVYPKRVYLRSLNEIHASKAYLRCYGFGLVRAIDTERKLFHVITPVEQEALKKVDIFALGHELQTPSIIMGHQSTLVPGKNPYVVRMDPNLIQDDTIMQMYNSLKAMTGHKRSQIYKRKNGKKPGGNANC